MSLTCRSSSLPTNPTPSNTTSTSRKTAMKASMFWYVSAQKSNPLECVVLICRPQTFKNPKPALLAALRESGPVPGDENGLKAKRPAGGEESAKKKKRTDKNVSGIDFRQDTDWQTGRLTHRRSTWIGLPRACRSLTKMISCRLFRWSMTTKQPTHTPRMTLNVSISISLVESPPTQPKSNTSPQLENSTLIFTPYRTH